LSIRTDLAIELCKDKNQNDFYNQNFGSIEVFFQTLQDGNEWGKPKGKYATVKTGKIDLLTDTDSLYKALEFCLEKLTPKRRENVLVVGLGNCEITSDSIGPFTVGKILATRHIIGDFADKIGLSGLKSVSAIAPNVLGKTGIEASVTVAAITEKIKPDLVIVIDALCASDTKNLFSVIQLTNTGISPGSGVKNSRKELSFTTLGVPTVAIGVPTVVEAKTIVENATNFKAKSMENLLLTPKDTDLLSHRISEEIARAINCFLQPDTDREILLALV
jgi:spore protease